MSEEQGRGRCVVCGLDDKHMPLGWDGDTQMHFNPNDGRELDCEVARVSASRDRWKRRAKFLLSEAIPYRIGFTSASKWASHLIKENTTLRERAEHAELIPFLLEEAYKQLPDPKPEYTKWHADLMEKATKAKEDLPNSLASIFEQLAALAELVYSSSWQH